jgi:hypothetical protein
MVLKVTKPENPDRLKDHLNAVVQYEFGRALPSSNADKIATRALALLDCGLDGWECGLDDWANGIVRFGSQSFTKKSKLLKERLMTLGVQLVKSTVMPICFEGKFEAALITLPGLQDIILKES